MNLLPLSPINSIFPYAINCAKFAAFTTNSVLFHHSVKPCLYNIHESKLTLLTSKPGWISRTCNELDQLKLSLAVKEWWKPWTPEIPRQDTDTSMFINIIATAAAFGREVASVGRCSMTNMFHHKNAHGSAKKYSKNSKINTIKYSKYGKYSKNSKNPRKGTYILRTC